MLSRFYYTYKTDGTITRSLYTDDNLFQGQVGVGEYFLAPFDLTDTNNILPTDAVLINFERPDGQTATLRMEYQSENGYWYKVSNGWETDVDITASADLTISFTAKRYSTVSATTLVKKFQTDSATITLTPSPQYSPLGISSGAEDEILSTLAEHEVAIAENAADIALKVDKTTTIAGVDLQDNITKTELKTALDIDDIENDVAENTANIALKVNTSDIVNNLTSIDTNKPLSAAQGKVLKNLADGKSKGVVFMDIYSMVTTLNNQTATYLKMGDAVYIYGIEVPDFWIAGDHYGYTEYTYTTDEALIEACKLAPVRIGHWDIGLLETAKVDLTNYVETSRTVNGHALSADVTVSKSDVGLGNAVNPGSAYGGTLTDNWNTLTLCGDYTSYTGATGLSAEMNALGVSWHGYHINSNVETGGAYQRLIAFVNTDIVCYERAKVAGTWGSWINTTLSKKAGLADNNTFTGTMTVLTPTEDMHAATKQYVDNSSASTAANVIKTITLTEDVSSLDVLDSSDNVTANKFLIEIRIPREDTPQEGNLTVRTNTNLTLNTGSTNVLYSAGHTIQKYIDIEYNAQFSKSIVYGNSSDGNIDNDSKDTPHFAGKRDEVSKYNQVKTINVSSTNFIFRTGTRIYVVKKES